ncbi:MAG: hypothetical protein JRF63_16385, partial [Deltaproteobacteria bacterium]|nr:hypothetical protein [Deltaproteobacteria bacterium]
DEMEADFGNCRDRDRVYLEDPAHLEVTTIDGRKYIGKRVKSGVARDRIEDTARSVVSLINRICDDSGLEPNQAVLIAIDEHQQPAESSLLDPPS